MHWITTPGTSMPEERRIVTRASHEMRSIDGVRGFGSHIGQAFLGEEIAGANFGENWVSVDPKADYDKTLASIHEVVDGHPGLYRNVQTYMRERIDEVLVGTSEPIVVRIYGDDLRRAAPGRGPGPGGDRRTCPASSTCTRRSRRRCRRSTSASTARGRAPLRRQAGGRPSRRGDARGQRGGRRPLPGRADLRRPRLEHARARARA